ncbi:hypothetical protein QYS48_15335 [Marivirga arenosa]|uniref:Uncharacterized protein n=1 Tax=Marivirga arenosa TaxID=3059076 RepID=A0AA49JHY0_9BACT|nr:hypothetical protein [Marivirga sp. ABR2-2]WKK83661.1 hypothetical protein QYS48_15335 [Marivirga sp. ABR2-2]
MNVKLTLIVAFSILFLACEKNEPAPSQKMDDVEEEVNLKQKEAIIFFKETNFKIEGVYSRNWDILRDLNGLAKINGKVNIESYFEINDSSYFNFFTKISDCNITTQSPRKFLYAYNLDWSLSFNDIIGIEHDTIITNTDSSVILNLLLEEKEITTSLAYTNAVYAKLVECETDVDIDDIQRDKDFVYSLPISLNYGDTATINSIIKNIEILSDSLISN